MNFYGSTAMTSILAKLYNESGLQVLGNHLFLFVKDYGDFYRVHS